MPILLGVALAACVAPPSAAAQSAPDPRGVDPTQANPLAGPRRGSWTRSGRRSTRSTAGTCRRRPALQGVAAGQDRAAAAVQVVRTLERERQGRHRRHDSQVPRARAGGPTRERAPDRGHAPPGTGVSPGLHGGRGARGRPHAATGTGTSHAGSATRAWSSASSPIRSGRSTAWPSTGARRESTCSATASTCSRSCHAPRSTSRRAPRIGSPPARTAKLLRIIGVAKVRGFMLNVTHYDWTANNIRHGAGHLAAAPGASRSSSRPPSTGAARCTTGAGSAAPSNLWRRVTVWCHPASARSGHRAHHPDPPSQGRRLLLHRPPGLLRRLLQRRPAAGRARGSRSGRSCSAATPRTGSARRGARASAHRRRARRSRRSPGISSRAERAVLQARHDPVGRVDSRVNEWLAR